MPSVSPTTAAAGAAAAGVSGDPLTGKWGERPMSRGRPRIEAVPVNTDQSSPTFPDPTEGDTERALRRDLVVLTAQRRARRRARHLRWSI
jgi:hypothetical protein